MKFLGIILGDFLEVKDALSTKVAGEIVLSNRPNETIRKWREIFEIPQTSLAERLGVSPSVISDYESGRRISPGANFVRRLTTALIEVDAERGGKVLKAYERIYRDKVKDDAILDIKEFTLPLKVKDICRIVKGEMVANEGLKDKTIYGYTVVDSLKAILSFSSNDFLRIFGLTSQRAIVFTKVSRGRSPFIAIRVSSIKPGLVVLHGLDNIDELGIEIAAVEKIPTILSGIGEVEELIARLRGNTT